MATETNGIATWGDLSTTYITRGTSNKCPTKSEIQSAVKTGYQVSFGNTYGTNQLVKYSDISFSSSLQYLYLNSVSFTGGTFSVNHVTGAVANNGTLYFDCSGSYDSNATYSGSVTIRLGTVKQVLSVPIVLMNFLGSAVRSQDFKSMGTSISVAASVSTGTYNNAYISAVQIDCSNSGYACSAGSTLSSSKITVYIT